jgi:multiple antibiotic resistance protein
MEHLGSVVEYCLLASTSLFVIIDPIALIPAFLAMTANDTVGQRVRMARLACIVTAIVLITFVIIGKKLFQLLGITIPAFKIAGSIVLLMVAMDMLKARRSQVQETTEETLEGSAKEDIAITPLAVPMLAGPGAISTAILLQAQAKGFEQSIALLGCIIAVSFAAYLVLRLAATGVQFISPIAMKITTRIMGLLLAAVAIQFILDALADQKGKLF